MKTSKKKWLSRALCAALAVTLVSGTAVMSPVADIIGTNITANAANYTTWGTCQWKVENGKLYIKGTIPNIGSPFDIPWCADSIRTTITEVYVETGTKTSANASYLFHDLTNATSMDLSNLSTSAATAMNRMFSYCSSLASLNMSGWNTSKVTDMKDMFYDCDALTSLDLSSWNTSSVKTMEDMFRGCNALTSLNLRNWNTQNVTDMGYMFYGCNSLKSVDVNGWNTQNVTSMFCMFSGCKALKKIYADKDWNTSNVTSEYSMFGNCENLVGGKGTAWSNTKKTTEYARIDGGPESTTPGYFTQGHAPLTYTVTWQYDDGTVIDTTSVEKGTSPVYSGATPTKKGNAQYTYTFSGWTSDGGTTVYTTETLPADTEDVTYTAVFESTVNTYTVTWKNDDGNTLKTDTVAYGTTPSYDGVTLPVSKTVDGISYVMTGWKDSNNNFYELNDLPTVTENATYTAVYGRVYDGNSGSVNFNAGDVIVAGTYFNTYNSGKIISFIPDRWGSSASSPSSSSTSFMNGGMTCYDDGSILFAAPGYSKKYPFNADRTSGNAWIVTDVNDNYFFFAGTTCNAVRWADEDGTILEADYNVEKGTTPSYDGEKPTKVPDENGKPYYFVGWKADDGTFYDITKKLPAVSENVTYTAVFKQAVEFEQGNTYHKGDIIGVSKSTYWIGANGKDGRNVGGRWYHNHAFLITNVSYTPDWSPNVYRFGPAYVFDIKDLINGGTDTIIVYAYKVHDNAEDAGLTVFGYYESPETHTMFNKFSEYLGDIDESFITFVNSTDSTPEIVLTYPVTGEILTQGTDYKVECNSENTAAVIGIGRFSGELQVNCVVLPREMKASITNRRKAGNNAKATLSGEWYLPKNATNIKAGIARLSTDDTNVTKYDVYNNGIKKASALKTTSGKYSFSLLMNSTHANQNLYAVTYVTYEIDGKKLTSISKVFASYSNPVA